MGERLLVSAVTVALASALGCAGATEPDESARPGDVAATSTTPPADTGRSHDAIDNPAVPEARIKTDDFGSEYWRHWGDPLHPYNTYPYGPYPTYPYYPYYPSYPSYPSYPYYPYCSGGFCGPWVSH
jgi:hypothetical protein